MFKLDATYILYDDFNTFSFEPVLMSKFSKGHVINETVPFFRDESKDIQDMIAKFRRLRGKEKIQWTAAGRKEKVAATGGGKKRKK